MLIDRRMFLAGLGGFAASWPGGSMAAAEAQSGLVETCSGMGIVSGKSGERRLEPQAAIFVGDTVTTHDGARASLKLGEATRIHLGANAQFRIDRFIFGQRGDFTLQGGAMSFDRPDKGDRSAVSVNTAFGLIGVRGTRFYAGPLDGDYAVVVDRGLVELRAGDQTRRLAAGNGITARRPTDPTGRHFAGPAELGPVQPLSRDRIRAVFATVEG